MKPIILAALLLAPLAAAEAQRPAPSQRPISTERVDRHGVRWLYGERNDAMDDRREIAAVALWRRSAIGLFCLAEEGARLRLMIAGWVFLPDVEDHVSIRIDGSDAVEVAVIGDATDGSRATVRPSRAGRDLVRAYAAARERIAIRNRLGETVIIPLAAPRPEVDRFLRRCAEVAPTLPEAATPPR